MGIIQHHALIVTSWDTEILSDAHRIASAATKTVTPVIAGMANKYASFAVLPDGSKEGWVDSDFGDIARERIIGWLEAQAYEDGSNRLSWAEVSFGEVSPTFRTNTPCPPSPS